MSPPYLIPSGVFTAWKACTQQALQHSSPPSPSSTTPCTSKSHPIPNSISLSPLPLISPLPQFQPYARAQNVATTPAAAPAETQGQTYSYPQHPSIEQLMRDDGSPSSSVSSVPTLGPYVSHARQGENTVAEIRNGTLTDVHAVWVYTHSTLMGVHAQHAQITHKTRSMHRQEHAKALQHAHLTWTHIYKHTLMALTLHTLYTGLASNRHTHIQIATRPIYRPRFKSPRTHTNCHTSYIQASLQIVTAWKK